MIFKMKSSFILFGGFLLLAVILDVVQPLCVLESDFGFKINCAFKKSGLFRVRNLGGVKAHASIGFSLGDELGFEQSLTNQDPSRRRSVSIKNGAPNILVDTTNRPVNKQEKRGKQNRIMMRPVAPVSRPNQASMDKLSSLHRRVSTMEPIVVPGAETANYRPQPTVTMAKPMAMGIPAFKPLPPKDETLKVLPIASKKTFSPYAVPQSKGPGMIYQNPVPHQVHDLANTYPAYNIKKIDDYNSISGYSDDTTLKFNKEDIDAKIAEIAKAGNISTEAVEAAIALRQQQLLSKYANIPIPTTTSTTTTTTEAIVFQVEPEPEIIVAPVPQKPKRNPTVGKVMNAPREYYPVGYEKNFDDHFQSKVDLPDTNFHCGDQKYFPGLYGDEGLGCMVFHVCALTDDGLVMKSFLCPESTLFDQTILKCNWWFYVDCKHTVGLYDTNIPVSKSYQLMKALTFFSSYKKEMEDGQPMNPEDVGGVREAITILENQDSKPSESEAVLVVTPLPIIDERHSRRGIANISSPVYRGTRDYSNSTEKRKTLVKKQESGTDFKLVTLDADISYENKSAERGSSEDTTTERKQRRRLAYRYKNTGTTHAGTTSTTTTTTSTTMTTQKPTEMSPLAEIIKQEIQPMENVEVKQEKLTDLIDDKIDSSILKESSPPVRRFYRSSAERDTSETERTREREIEIINNEKVQIVRPTSSSNLDYTETISRLDQAVLGKSRLKKDNTRQFRVR